MSCASRDDEFYYIKCSIFFLFSFAVSVQSHMGNICWRSITSIKSRKNVPKLPCKCGANRTHVTVLCLLFWVFVLNTNSILAIPKKTTVCMDLSYKRGKCRWLIRPPRMYSR